MEHMDSKKFSSKFHRFHKNLAFTVRRSDRGCLGHECWRRGCNCRNWRHICTLIVTIDQSLPRWRARVCDFFTGGIDAPTISCRSVTLSTRVLARRFITIRYELTDETGSWLGHAGGAQWQTSRPFCNPVHNDNLSVIRLGVVFCS
jgi:hypothetical protein